MGLCADILDNQGMKRLLSIRSSRYKKSLLWSLVLITETVGSCAGIESFNDLKCAMLIEFAFLSEWESHLFLDRLTFSTPRRPFERERLDQELRICGEFGLRCKREIWRVQLVLAKIRKVLFSA